MARKQSRTVDLRGFTLGELRAIVGAGWKLEQFDRVPDAAAPAFARLHTALVQIDATGEGQARAFLELFGSQAPDAPVRVSRIDRDSLAAFVEALRPTAQTFAAAPLNDAFTKLERRLDRRSGRPAAQPEAWRRRAADVRRATRTLAKRQGYPPTDRQLEDALGVTAGTIRRWRWHEPELFGPPAGRAW